MKKTLLASAILLAFASGAMAATYQEGKGEAVTAESQDRILGGWKVTESNASDVVEAGSIVGNVTMNSGTTADMVIGGHYVAGDYGGGKTNFSNVELNVSSTSVTINGGKVKSAVIGGTGSTDASGLTHAGSAVSNLTINGGEFGQAYPSDDNCLKIFVTGGDLMKQNGPNRQSGTLAQGHLIGAESHIETVNTTINDGTFNAIVLGGSVATQYYGGPVTDEGVEATVGTANLTINGGTFERPISAGGVAWGHYAKATVDTANLVIDGSNDNLDIQADIYSGGVYGFYGSSVNADATVNTSNVTIKNATVQNVYGTHSEMKVTTNDGKYVWSQDKLIDKAVNTNLTLVNVNATDREVVVPLGTVELRAEGKDGKTTVGTLSVEGATVSLTADGEANEAALGDITKVIDIDFESVAGATVAMAEGMYQGAVTGTIGEDGKAVVTQATNSVMSNTLDLASSAPLAMNRLLMNDVRKRMGDLRAAEGTHGVWARYDGGKLSGANGLENDFTTVQVGIDTVPVADAPRFGVAFAYTTSDADMKRGGAEMDAFSLAFYGTKFYDNGMFVDVIGRMATADTDVTVDGDKKGSMDNVALSLSGELGWRFDVTEKFYFEPQAELTYTYVNSDTLALEKGGTYEFDSVDSLMARVGFAAGFKCPSNFGAVYVRASAVHEFLGDATVRGGGVPYEVDGEDTWVEFGIGANFNVNKNTYVYADIERTEGAKLEEDWRANVGVRFAF